MQIYYKMKATWLLLAALFSVNFAFAESGTETEPSSIPGKDNAIEGQCYTIPGTYNAGGGSTKVGNMTSKGFKCRTGSDGSRVVFSVNENYTITKFVGNGISNYVADNDALPGITVTKVEVDGAEVAFTSDGFPGKGASTSGNITIENIQAKQSIAIYFDNSNSSAGKQINLSYELAWERPDAAQPTIKVTPAEVILVPGATYQLTAKVDPSSFTTIWTSELPEVATVSEEGLVTAVSAGAAAIKSVWDQDKTVYGVSQIYVTPFDPADFEVAKEYDFTAMGDVTLAIEETAAGNIWNEGNNKVNAVYFCTNEGLEDIAVQAVVSSNKGWSIIADQGLTLASGAGRCAAIGHLKAGEIVEIIYTGSHFYTGSNTDATRKDDGADKTPYNQGIGRAIYKMNEDGMLGFEIERGKAIQKIIVYSTEVEETDWNQFIANADFASVEGWTPVTSDGYKDFGNGLIGTYQVRSDFAAATVDETHLATEYCLGVEARWSTNFASFTQTTAELPEGNYKLYFDVENVNSGTTKANYKNLFNVTVGEQVFTDESTEWMNGQSAWTTHAIKFTLTEPAAVTISLGYGTGDNNLPFQQTPALYISHLQLDVFDALEEAKNDFEDALATAQETLKDDVVTGQEKDELSNAISANSHPEESEEALKNAIEALNAAVANYNAAKAAYQALADAKANIAKMSFIYAQAEKLAAAEAAAQAVATSAEDATAKKDALLQAYRVAAESHALLESIEGAVNKTDVIVNPLAEEAIAEPWVITLGEGSGGSLDVKSSEPFTDADGNSAYKYFDGGNWGANAWDVTLSQEINLPKGKYLLTVTSRAAADMTSFNLFAGDLKVEMPFVGASVGTGLFDRGWNEASVEFELTEDAAVTIGVQGIANKQYQWMSFSRFRLMQFPGAEEPTFDYGTIWDAETDAAPEAQGEYMAIELNKGYFQMAQKSDIVRVNYAVPEEARAQAPLRTMENADVALLCVTGETTEVVNEIEELYKTETKVEIILDDAMLEQLQNCDQVFVRYRNVDVNKIELIKGADVKIDGMQMKRNDNVIYNLNGQQVKKAQKGLYIVNGKKVIVK